MTIGGERSDFTGLIVDLIQQNQHIKLLGIRLSRESKPNTEHEDRRAYPRWICSDQFLPSCVAPSAVRIHDYTYFLIKDISSQGFQLICSLRNKFLVPGMTLNLACSFPLIGEMVARARIVRVDLASHRGKDVLSIGVTFEKLGGHSRNVVAQYLVQFSNVDSIESLRRYGFRPASVSKGVVFSFLKTEEEYRQVLKLRYLAHSAEGTIAKDASPDDMGDLNDIHARIIIGRHRDKFVATARVRFNDSDNPLEHEEYISIPRSFPPRNQIQEISRVCTHPDYRRSDLLASLFHFACSTALSLDRPWYLVSSFESMVTFYKHIGYRDTGLSHSDKRWNEPQIVLLGNAVDAMFGKNTHPLYWNIIWREVSDYLIEHGAIVPSQMDRARMRALKTIGFISNIYLRFRRRYRTR